MSFLSACKLTFPINYTRIVFKFFWGRAKISLFFCITSSRYWGMDRKPLILSGFCFFGQEISYKMLLFGFFLGCHKYGRWFVVNKI
mgnify:CR=1 FL=1